MAFPHPSVFKGFHLALIQLGQTGPDKAKNLIHAKEMILRAASGNSGKHPKPNLIVLPEIFNSPYGIQYFHQYAEKIGYVPGEKYDVSKSESESVRMLSEAAIQTGTWLIGGSIPERDSLDDKKLYNTSTVYSPQGSLVAIHRKVHLFDISIPGKIKFQESATLSPGSSVTYFDTDFARIGLGLCYDIRFPEMAMIASRKGAQIMIYPSAFNMTTGPMHWELLQRARAVDNQIYVSMCSPARNLAADYHAWGHTMLLDPMGEIVASTEEKEDIVYGFVDPNRLRDARESIPVTKQRRFDVYPDVSAEFQ